MLEREQIEIPKVNMERKKVPWQVFLLMAIIAGTITGFVLAKNKAVSVGSGGKVAVIKSDKEEGVSDNKSFRDDATGTIEKNDGKITDEGSHKLMRGDASQTVYLTSSIIDLDQYVGKKVQIFGETFQGQRAGWLMDVGRIKLLE